MVDTSLDTSATLPESIEEFVRQCMTQTGSAPSIELVTFSGKAADWERGPECILVRCTRTQSLDDDGEPYEAWLRLFAPAGLWHIPRVQTEMLAIIPPNLGELAGNGWALWGAQVPPEAVTQERALLAFDDETVMASRAKAHMFRSAHGTAFGVDPATGDFVVTFAGGSRFVLKPSGAQFVFVSDSAPPAPVTIKTVFDINREAVSWSIDGKAAARWDNTGRFVSEGAGIAVLRHLGGKLGLAPSGAVGTSVTWTVGP
jgi:hypothetical protein